jgi:hypothetical protein
MLVNIMFDVKIHIIKYVSYVLRPKFIKSLGR